MTLIPKFVQSNNWHREIRRGFFPIWLIISTFPVAASALPNRLMLALDGVAYRDMKALQSGVTCTNFWGGTFQRRAFTAEEGFFPVSRMISTFPSTSDVAWTDIFGDRPLPGYQRTYFSSAANTMISINGVTTTMEHERQMDWQVQNGALRATGYMFPVHTYEYEMRGMVELFWKATPPEQNFYGYLRASDDAQHLDRDIFALLCQLDQKLQNLRADYRAREGRDLQIVILSDHGHNHAGRGQRIGVRAFLEHAGYHIAKTIAVPKDVVLPTVGIESWVEIHNAPTETEKLAQLLSHLKGVDVLTATVPNQTNCFVVMNFKGARAIIQWNSAKNSFRYSTESGDPIKYLPVVAALAQRHQLDADGFAAADAWMAATMTNHYPLAVERIVRGLTRNTLNPGTILISLDNHYVNDNWLVQNGSRLVTCGSTHGGLDDLNSDGILLSNFAPTKDTSTQRVSGQFDDFPGLNDFRMKENGAEWITKKEQAMTRIAHVPFDRDFNVLPNNDVCLRIWSPELTNFDRMVPVAVAIERTSLASALSSWHGDFKAEGAGRRQLIFDRPLSLLNKSANERVYSLPPDLRLEPYTGYKISGWIQEQNRTVQLFKFSFDTNADGQPAAY